MMYVPPILIAFLFTHKLELHAVMSLESRGTTRDWRGGGGAYEFFMQTSFNSLDD